MTQDRRVGVLGLGHVGLPTALGFAEIGWTVVGTDNDESKVTAVDQGVPPFFEPGLEELLRKHLASGRFKALRDVGETVRQSDILFICVGTPHCEDGSADLSQVEGAARVVAENLTSYKLVVEKSTAPVMTARWIERAILRHGDGKNEFEVACNPEFLREGTAIHDFLHPDRVVIGALSEKARSWLAELYGPLGRPMLITDLNTAEMIKHASNAFLALKISYINMVSDLCEAAGANVKDLATGLGLDPRIGSHFLQAGIGYGGFCLPKDLKAFMHVAEELGVNFDLLREVERVNQSRVEWFVRKVQKALWVLRDKKLAVWGLAFKPQTDDIREAPSVNVVRRLRQAGALLRLYDPAATQEFRQVFPEERDRLVYCSSAIEAARGADAILVLTEWPEFREMDWKQVRECVVLPVVVDGRNCLDATALKAEGFEYHCMGETSALQEVVESEAGYSSQVGRVRGFSPLRSKTLLGKQKLTHRIPA
jgi:UDPglucose 6-dehydrogenase